MISKARSTASLETCCRTCTIAFCSSKRIVIFFESSKRLESSLAALIRFSFSFSICAIPFLRISSALAFACSKRARA